MSDLNIIHFRDMSSFDIGDVKGKLVLLIQPDGVMDENTILVDALINGVIKSFIDTDVFKSLKAGSFSEVNFFIKKEFLSILIFKKNEKYSANDARLIGAKIAKVVNNDSSHIIIGDNRFPEEVAFGLKLRSYNFSKYKKLKSESNYITSVYVLDALAAENSFIEKT